MVSTDGLEIFVASSRDSTTPENDVWHATRADPAGAFGTPSRVAEVSEPAANDGPTWISEDRCTLVLVSDRGTSYDLWIARRPQ